MESGDSTTKQIENLIIYDNLSIPSFIFKYIFTYLKFSEIVRLRYVCKMFNKWAAESLNESFLQLSGKVTKCLEDTLTELKAHTQNQNVIRYFKIINFLRSEYNMMKSVFKHYLMESLCVFTGGKILDYFLKIVTINYRQIQYNYEYIKIFHLVGAYLDYFENTIEPEILERCVHKTTSWIGVKILNILDASLELNHRLELTYGADCLYLDGEYDGEGIFSPDLSSKYDPATRVRSFIQYVRTSIRWNNLVYCIESTTTQLAENYNEPELQVNSHNSVLFQKTVTNGWKQPQGVSYAVNMKCSHDHLPLRLASLVKKNTSYADMRQSHTKRSPSGLYKDEKQEEKLYQFHLTMKVRTHYIMEGEMNEKVIKLSQVGNTCTIAELNELPNVPED